MKSSDCSTRGNFVSIYKAAQIHIDPSENCLRAQHKQELWDRQKKKNCNETKKSNFEYLYQHPPAAC